MASIITRLWTKLSTRRVSISVMLVGLDNSGKSSILSKLASLNNVVSKNTSQNLDSVIEGSAPCNFVSERFQEQISTDHETLLMSTSLHNRGNSSSEPQSDNNTSSSRSTDCEQLILSYDHFDKISPDRKPISAESGGSMNTMPTIGYNYEQVQYKNVSITILDFSGQNRYRNLWQEFYNVVDAIVFVVDSSDLIRFAVARDELETLINHPYFLSLSRDAHISKAPARDNVLLPCIRQQKQITISQGKLIQEPLQSSNLESLASTETVSNRLRKRLAFKQVDFSRTLVRQRLKVPILFLANKTDLPHSVETEVIVKALNLNDLPIDRHPWSIQATSAKQNQGIREAFDWLISELLTVN